jgi:hypothetical protein
LGKGAVVKLEVGEEACFFVLAVEFDVGALGFYRDFLNGSALYFNQRRCCVLWV